MPIITSIKPQKNQKRVNIYIDNKFRFGLDLENFVKFHLKVDQELEEEKINEIIKEAEFQKILDRLLKFATYRPRSVSEVEFWFKRKKVPEVIQLDLFNQLKDLELLDDLKFARWWVEQRQLFSPKPKKVLEMELKLKGVDREIIKMILEGTKVDEVKLAKVLIKNKMYKWEKINSKIRRQKIVQYLIGKGFDWNIINEAV